MFGKLFRMFSKNILPDEELLSKNIVTPYPLRRKKMKVNAKLEVPQGFQAVIVRGGKIMDVISVGRHRVNGSTMPSVFQKLKIGKASKKGNYRTKFKAEVYFVNLRTFVKFPYTSDNAFHTRSESFGRVKGYAEGYCELHVEDAEELMKFLMRYLNKLTPKNVREEVGHLVGNAVNKVLEKSKLSFSQVLLNPEGLKTYLNPTVSNMVSEYGLLAEQVELASLQLTKRVQKRVTEFLSNRGQFEQSDFVFEPNEKYNETEQSQVFQSVEHEPEMKQQEQEVEEAEQVQQGYTQPQQSNKQPQPQNNPLLNRRLSNANLIEPGTNTGGVVIPSLNTGELLTDNANDLKQCKYCGATIEMHHKYCPKCGFKQY